MSAINGWLITLCAMLNDRAWNEGNNVLLFSPFYAIVRTFTV